MALSPDQIRASRPEWKNLDDKALADAVYEKFYADMPREQYDAKVADAWSEISNNLSAGFASGVNALPIVGPMALGGLEHLKGMAQGRSFEDVAASDAAQMQAYPVASGIGEFVGTVAPLALGASIPAVARTLGIDGAMPLVPRTLASTMSQGILTSGDKLARGYGW